MRKASVLVVIAVAAFLVTGSGLAAAQGAAAGQEKKAAAATADPLSGEWAGTVESPQGTIGFTMKLQLEKDKVTGDISSDQGGTALSGTWAESKFSATFDYNGTAVAMTGTIKDEAFGGEMNFGGGQMVMTWTAKKKAAK